MMNLIDIAQRNSTALAALYTELTRRENAFLLEHVERRAPDVLGDVFLEVYRKIRADEVHSIEEIWPLAHTIARRLVQIEIEHQPVGRKLPLAA